MAKRKKQIIIFLILIINSYCFYGCSSKPIVETKYIETPVYVNIPIIEKPKIKPINRPILEIEKITNDSSPTEIVELYYNSLQQLIKYSKLLEKALSPFYEEYKNDRQQQTTK